MSNHKESSIEKLSKLTSKDHIFFTDRGNTSIFLSLKLAKDLGKKRVIIQDQGGWITYSQFIKKLKLENDVIETDYGLAEISRLKLKLDSTCALLLNSMPGYFAVQDNMKEIASLCRKTGTLLINDASGSIGRSAAKYGDIILGSFGKWKPVELEYGGFIAFDEPDYEAFFKENFKQDIKDFHKELNKKLELLPKKIKALQKTTDKIKKQLRDFDIIHRDKKGFNVIIRFINDEQKLKIIEFCKLYGYEFTLCPRYIRVLENAISIEVKRI